MTQTPTRPTADFIDFLGRKYACRPINLLESQLVAETWAMAKVPAKTATATIAEIATAHVKFGDPLIGRLLFVRGVIYDTLQKMSGEVPPELRWAESHKQIRILGIVRKPTFGTVYDDISWKIKSGITQILESDAVRVTSFDSSGRTTMNAVDIVLSTLSNNPTVISQAARKACKEHTGRLAAEADGKARASRKDLAARIATLQAELVSMDEAAASDGAPEITATPATGAALTAERAARRAAKLAEHQAATTEQASR